ncbi:E3 ubiquitin-protein ligase xbat33 [Castilleja foliolosa]|uniref:RING-type E3 ubiquitin transferase n=1 Tax=Castilleja foliolosa TaxID=1961234 RepID=A0ABD3E7P8_9LAMI
MGNSIGCSASGERLVSAARDGDFEEAKMLLDCNPHLAKYSTFGGLNSPLHFASSKGHNEIVALLLENGADVNSRNFSGQTPLMQACRYGHWEVVQTLLLYRCNVTKADYLNGRTALHFATVNGHVRCIRLVLTDFVPSAPFESWSAQTIRYKNNSSNDKTNDLFKFVNKAADGGLTALHMASLNGYIDSVQLLLDLGANTSATTFNYGNSMDLVGAGSTPLHYAACGGNLKCCQILVARGASRLALNCNGCVLNIARDGKSKLSATPSDESDTCAVCLERVCSVSAEGCAHELCVRCALYLCSSSNISSEPSTQPGSIPSCSETQCSDLDSRERQHQESSEREKTERMRLDKSTCSNMVRGSKRSREHQCNAEINA